MKNTPKLTKAERPETLAQAQEWQRSLHRYQQVGLCHICAAQAAYGHSIGFTKINPPCDLCAPIIATFPTKAAAPWRMMTRADHSAARAKRESAA